MPSKFAWDVTTIPILIAEQVHSGTSSDSPPKTIDLAEAIGDVQIRTEILGASFMTVTVIDPNYEFINDGWLMRNPEGLLDELEIEFPLNTDFFWRLCSVDLSTDKTQANVTLTFEDRIIADLRDHWTPLTVRNITVLDFIKQLVTEAGITDFHCPALGVVSNLISKTPGQDNSTTHTFLTPKSDVTPKLSKAQCKNLNEALTSATTLGASSLALKSMIVAGFTETNWISVGAGGSQPASGYNLSANQAAFVSEWVKITGMHVNAVIAWTFANNSNDHGGVANNFFCIPLKKTSSTLTVNGITANSQQRQYIDLCSERCAANNAGPVATEALFYAAINESAFGEATSGPGQPPESCMYQKNSALAWGLLQGTNAHWTDPRVQVSEMIDAFLLGGFGYNCGGAIALEAGTGTKQDGATPEVALTNPRQIAIYVETPSFWPINQYEPGGGSQVPGGSDGPSLNEAKALIAGGGSGQQDTRWLDPTTAAEFTWDWIRGARDLGRGFSTPSEQAILFSSKESAQLQVDVIKAGANDWSDVSKIQTIYDQISNKQATSKGNALDNRWGALLGDKNFFAVGETAAMAVAFMNGNEGYHASAMDEAQVQTRTAGSIAAQIMDDGTKAATFDLYDAIADQIIKLTYGFTGGPKKNTFGVVAGVPNVSGGSPGTFTRGTTEVPIEDSWDCIQRVLREFPPSTTTTWSAFSNGNTFFVLNGWEMLHQTPAAYIDIAANVYNMGKGDTKDRVGDVISCTATFDNTAFIYANSKVHHGKVQRRSRISKPSTPSLVTLELGCGIDEFRAGQVFSIQNFGPATGEWIITDATRNTMADTFTTFTLEPPVESNIRAPTTKSQLNAPKKKKSDKKDPFAPVPGKSDAGVSGVGTPLKSPMSGVGWDNMFGKTTRINTSRIDQGCDWANIEGPIGAVAAGTVTTIMVTGSGFDHGPIIVLQLEATGLFVYYALEDGATPLSLKVGDKVKAGDEIAVGVPSGSLEIGFSSGGGGGSNDSGVVPISPYGSPGEPPKSRHDLATSGGIQFAMWVHAGAANSNAAGVKPDPKYNPGP